MASPPASVPYSGGESDAHAIEALIDRAHALERQGRRDEARTLFERALYQLSAQDDPAQASALLRWAGQTFLVDAHYDAALDCFEAALAIAEALGDQGAAGHAVNLRAIQALQQGDLDQAERDFRLAREHALRAGEARLAAMTAQNLGVLGSVRGDLEQALRDYEASLADCRALGLPKYICTALNNLGMLYTELRRWHDAERAYEEAVALSESLGDVSAGILLAVNLAELWVARGDLERARTSCDRAMEMSRRIDDAHAHGETFKIYGVIARESGDAPLADEYFERASRIASERQDLLLSAQIAREMAELYRRQGRNRDTLQCLNRAYRLFSQLRARRDIADIARRTSRLEGEFLDVVRRWGESIESKDHYTQGHCERVADLACALAARTGMDEKSLFWFRIGALLHDVGKLVIPPEVLNKPGRLTEDEWAQIRRHPIAGVEMLSEIEFPWDVCPIVEYHHESWDGSGYPHGLAGENIPITARIVCLADVYDALTSERSYKKPLAHADAMQIMRRDVGRQFDPELFRLFEELFEADPSLRHGAGSAVRSEGAALSRTPTDELTGLPLRRAFADSASALLAAARASASPVSLLVIDVDHFKRINDSFGHLQGDDVLRAVADAIRHAVRPGDVVARYAGDEFVVLLPETTLERACEIGERLRDLVERRRLDLRGAHGDAITTTLSIGAATCPEHGDTLETLFAAADRALYDAKLAGRNAVASAACGAADVRTPVLGVDRFVGRARELRRLVRLLDASTRGEPRIAAVVGEAGIGKSTLVEQLAPEVRLRAGSLLVGRCVEADVKPPYGPWAEIIEAIRVLGVVPARPWRELPGLVPALARDRRDEPGVDDAREQLPTCKYALLDELAEYITLAAASRPLTIVLDDVHWGDAGTWDALEHLVQRLDHERVFVCLTARSEDLAGVAERRYRLARDARYREIAVDRLGREELGEWIEGVVREGGERTSELAEFLHRHTEGNPLLVVQVLRTLHEEGAIWHSGSRWEWRSLSELRLPNACGELIARRISRLSAKARLILATAAVMGREFDADLVIATGAGTEDEVLDALDEGLGAAVIAPSGTGGADRFTFAHGLLAEAMRASINGRRLRTLRHRVAAALERQRPEAVEEIAAHYDAADASDEAYRFALLASERASRVVAYDEATAFLEMALRHATVPARVIEVAYRLARVAELSGHYERAERHCAIALDGVHASAEPHPRFRALERARARLRVLGGEPPRETLRVCTALLAAADEAEDATECAALLGMLAQAHSRLGDWSAAERLAQESVMVAEASGDALLVADLLVRLGSTVLETRPLEARGHYERALARFLEADDPRGQVRCRINVGIALARAGDVRAADAAYERATALAHAAHAPDLAGLALLNHGVLRLRSGSYDRARAHFEEALRLVTAVRNEPHRLAALYNLAHLAREEGDLAYALEQYDECVSIAARIGQGDIELGARAGAGLIALAMEASDDALGAWRTIDAALAERARWWFQGRELVEALRVRIALRGDRDAAERAFLTGLSLAEAHDPYGAAWLVADCAPLLGLAEIVAEYAPRAERLGLAPLIERFGPRRSGA